MGCTVVLVCWVGITGPVSMVGMVGGVGTRVEGSWMGDGGCIAEGGCMGEGDCMGESGWMVATGWKREAGWSRDVDRLRVGGVVTDAGWRTFSPDCFPCSKIVGVGCAALLVLRGGTSPPTSAFCGVGRAGLGWTTGEFRVVVGGLDAGRVAGDGGSGMFNSLRGISIFNLFASWRSLTSAD